MKTVLSLCGAIFLTSASGLAWVSSAGAVPVNAALMAQSSAPTTSLTKIDANQIAIQIKKGDFSWHGTLSRTYGDLFGGTDGQVRVNYDSKTGRVVVIDDTTGDEFYNYIYRAPASSNQHPSTTPKTVMQPTSADAFMVEITEGEFKFRGPLTRSSGNVFIGSDGRVRIIYDKNASRIVVINVVTGTEFYNYSYTYR